jgi:hypothetical protein
VIEVVTEADLERLGAIQPHSPNAKMRAAGILTEIISRLPRPRAYISEPTHSSDPVVSTLWTVAYDMLSAQLSSSGTSVIESDTLRDISLFCSELEKLTDSFDPLWQALVTGKLVDEIYIPADGENSKRHAAMRKIARSVNLTVISYRPQHTVERRAAQPPQV